MYFIVLNSLVVTLEVLQFWSEHAFVKDRQLTRISSEPQKIVSWVPCGTEGLPSLI